MNATCLAHLILLHIITLKIFGERVKIMKLLIKLFSPSSCYFLPRRYILLNTLNLCSSLRATDQVSYPYKTTGITTLLCISSSSFYTGDKIIKYSKVNGKKHYQNLNFF
jgi:hypothetical protein